MCRHLAHEIRNVIDLVQTIYRIPVCRLVLWLVHGFLLHLEVVQHTELVLLGLPENVQVESSLWKGLWVVPPAALDARRVGTAQPDVQCGEPLLPVENRHNTPA